MKKLIAGSVLVFMALVPFVYAGGKGETASSESYPSRPITLFVGSTAGGSFDLGVRILAPYLEKELGTTVNVVNSPGAAGWVIWTECLSKAPDGYNIYGNVVPNVFMSYNPALKNSIRISDFQLIANEVRDVNALFANKDSKVKNLKQFIDYCSGNADIIIGTTAIGGDDHLTYLKIINAFPEMQKNTKPLTVSDVTETITNQLGGFTDFMIGNVSNYNAVRDKMNCICVFGETRSILLSHVPTFNELAKEMGLNQTINNSIYRGYMMPKGGDPVLIRKITTAFEMAMTQPEFKEKLKSALLEWNALTGSDYEEFMANEVKEYESLLPMLGWK
jgi:tripartite-type tricarboxylate transporter receptor subunit TctC